MFLCCFELATTWKNGSIFPSLVLFDCWRLLGVCGLVAGDGGFGWIEIMVTWIVFGVVNELEGIEG